MAMAAEHYENLLADHYSWMCGGFDARVRSNLAFFSAHGIAARGSGVAVDLGAGSGFQSIPLAQLGYKVLAVDLSRKLLDELNGKRGGLPITPIHDGLLNFPAHCEGPIELCICMGDTLPHLATFEQLQILFARVYRLLEVGGRFILTFRDLTCELRELDRFIPVRSDTDTIFTCFLEYETAHVRVHDLVYSRSGDRWVLSKSWYRKLRISAERAVEWLKEAGFTIDLCDNINGLITIIAGKPAG